MFSARRASSARRGLTVTSFKLIRLPLTSIEAGGLGWITHKAPGGSAAPETHVEKYQPIRSGKTMKTTMRSGFVTAVRANKRRRSGLTNSSQKASVEET